MTYSVPHKAATVGLAISLMAGMPAAADDSPRHATTVNTRLPAMVAKVLPAVVSIATREIATDQFNRDVVRRGLGSGSIFDRRGYIVTNNHVVEGASDIKVALPDGRRFRATLVGRDRFTDLAALKIEGHGLPVIPLGESRRLRIAETVVALGNPLWIEGGATVTVGVVSGLGRSMEQEDLPVLHNLIQTDAAINPGNSGGPLVDVQGRVVGINTALIASAHGIGFAITIDDAKGVLKTLLAGQRIERPSLGVGAVSLTPQLAWANDLPIERGVLVTRVEEGGPAERGGVRPDDVITAMDREPMRDLHYLHETLARRKAGSGVQLTVWRAGESVAATVQLGAEP